jgi:type VI secretion system protein ImpA
MIAAVAKEYFRFDLETIANPIRPDAQSGDDLRYEGTYDDIRKAREEDDASLQQGIWKRDLKTANWSKVEALALDALRTRSKDIQIACWLTEAWIHIHGLAGLREGVRVVCTLCERFWDTVYPGGSPADPEYRAGPIVWLNERIPNELRLMPLSMPQNDELQAYCLADWERAMRPPPPKPKRGEEPEARLTLDMFERSVLATPTPYYSDLAGELDRAMEAVRLCQEIIDFRWSTDAPSLHAITSTLETMRGMVSTILSTREVPGPAPGPSQGIELAEESEGMADTISVNGEPDSGEMSIPGVRGPIRNRTEAYRMLTDAADFLARTEPHSPTPYLVRRAIAWGGLKFEDLVQELVQNKNELDTIYKLLQIHK